VKRVLLEVAVESLGDAIAAVGAGADRLELCADLRRGGVTVPIELYRSVRSALSVPLAVMIRPVADDSFSAVGVLEIMLQQIEARLVEPPAAFVFGALKPDRSIDPDACRVLIAACRGVPAVFHRAWDAAARGIGDLELLIDLGFRRLLTSGCQPTAVRGADAIRGYVERSSGRIEIMPGSGIGPENAAAIIAATGCGQIHGTFRRKDSAAEGVRVDPERLREARAVLDQLARAG
jgi:copper homeostasis protein